jgi:lactate dehydrogenase-like 2-hydroxyacid dehydrogenase
MNAKADVLIVAPMFPAAIATIEREFNAHKLYQAQDRKALIASVADRVRGIATTGTVGAKAELIEALPKLEIIACFGVGYDGVDVDAARRHKVIVTNTPDVLTDCVADLTLSLLLAVARRICAADRYVRAGRWLQGPMPLASKVGGKTCGIVGLGRIGMAIAKRAEAFGMRIAYHGPRSKDVPYRYYPALTELARDADYLVLTTPGGAETRHLVDAAVIDALGPEGTLINVARGSVVDEAALVEALRSGRLGAAGLDVYQHEPQVPDALLAMDNVVLLPHIGSATRETRAAMGELTVANLRAHFAGEPVLTRVA